MGQPRVYTDEFCRDAVQAIWLHMGEHGMKKGEMCNLVRVPTTAWKHLRRAFPREGLRIEYNKRDRIWHRGRRHGGTLALFESIIRPQIRAFREDAVNVMQDSASAAEAVARLIDDEYNPVELLLLCRVIGEDFPDQVETLLLEATSRMLPELPGEVRVMSREVRRIARLLEAGDDRAL